MEKKKEELEVGRSNPGDWRQGALFLVIGLLFAYAFSVLLTEPPKCNCEDPAGCASIGAYPCCPKYQDTQLSKSTCLSAKIKLIAPNLAFICLILAPLFVLLAIVSANKEVILFKRKVRFAILSIIVALLFFALSFLILILAASADLFLFPHGPAS